MHNVRSIAEEPLLSRGQFTALVQYLLLLLLLAGLTSMFVQCAPIKVMHSFVAGWQTFVCTGSCPCQLALAAAQLCSCTP